MTIIKTSKTHTKNFSSILWIISLQQYKNNYYFTPPFGVDKILLKKSLTEVPNTRNKSDRKFTSMACQSLYHFSHLWIVEEKKENNWLVCQSCVTHLMLIDYLYLLYKAQCLLPLGFQIFFFEKKVLLCITKLHHHMINYHRAHKKKVQIILPITTHDCQRECWKAHGW